MASSSSSTPANEKKAQSTGATAGAGSSSTYISGGQVLASAPVMARINSAVTTIYNAGGLYLASLFSLDPYNAAMNSRFNTRGPGRNNMPAGGRTVGNGSNNASSWFGFGTGGRGGGSGGNGGGRPGGRRFGTVDDVRGPECGSCQ